MRFPVSLEDVAAKNLNLANGKLMFHKRCVGKTVERMLWPLPFWVDVFCPVWFPISEWELLLHIDIWYLEKVIWCQWIMFMMRYEWVYIYLCTQWQCSPFIKPLFLLVWVRETHMTINYSWIKYHSNSQWKLEIVSCAAIEMDFSQGVTHTWNWAISSYPWNKIAISANAWIEVYETLKSHKRTHVSCLPHKYCDMCVLFLSS